MINVRMSADDRFYGESVAAEQVHDAMDFVSRIEDQSLARDRVGDDRAIALQQTHGNREVKKVLRSLRRRDVRHMRQYNIRWKIVRSSVTGAGSSNVRLRQARVRVCYTWGTKR
jgi:urease alpha subunit